MKIEIERLIEVYNSRRKRTKISAIEDANPTLLKQALLELIER